MIHGLDPFDYANFSGLRDYLHTLGFNNTYYGQLYHAGHFKGEVRRIHREDPEARFVLIGFSFGANMVRSIAQDVKSEGIRIPLLVYLGGNTLENTPEDHPDNADRLVNILANGWIWNGAQFDDAENINEDDVHHFGSPTHPRTLEALTREITEVASSVPVVERLDSQPATDSNEEPTPRPANRASPAQHDGWDFLKPVTRLGTSPEQNQDNKATPAGGQPNKNTVKHEASS
jgi:hypothetical protein